MGTFKMFFLMRGRTFVPFFSKNFWEMTQKNMSMEIKEKWTKDCAENIAMWRKAKWDVSFCRALQFAFIKSKTLMQWSSYADKLMKFFLKVRRRLTLKELRYCCVAARGNLVNCLWRKFYRALYIKRWETGEWRNDVVAAADLRSTLQTR